MPTILSTKKLALHQKELLLNSGMALVAYNAIVIEYLDFALETNRIENAIFTSKNALKAIEERDLNIQNCFCVGKKTSAAARQLGFHILEIADNAEELASKVLENHKNKEFQFFSGDMRREELPEILKNNNIKFKETTVYSTVLNFRRFDSQFDGIMFFSPSGVKSFTANNKLDTKAFCIGETTATEARKHTSEIIVASKPSIENVIAKVVSEYKKNKNISE